jgi:hypothetical protein
MKSEGMRDMRWLMIYRRDAARRAV